MVDGEVVVPKIGIENLKKVVTLIAVLANTGDAVGHASTTGDKLNQLLSLGEAIRVIPGLDWKQVLPEIKDLDEVEREELRQVFGSKLDLTNDKLEAAIEEGIGIAADFVGIVEKSKRLVEKFKAA